MSTAEFPKPSDLVPEDELVPPPVDEQHAEPQPSPKRTGRRWEIGFFARKVIEGRLEYLKLLKSLARLSGKSQSQSSDRGSTREDGGQLEPPEREFQPLTGHENDGGPVGKASFELGFFVGASTEPSAESGV